MPGELGQDGSQVALAEDHPDTKACRSPAESYFRARQSSAAIRGQGTALRAVAFAAL